MMNKRLTSQLYGLSRDVISTTVVVLTGHCIMIRHAERIRLLFSNFCVDTDPLKKRKLLSPFFVSARVLLGVDIVYLAPHFLSP